MVAERMDYYVRLEDVCRQMLEAARGGDWNRVADIEGDTHALIARLREARQQDALGALERREKFRILRNIVEIDAQIRHLAQPWQRTVDRMLSFDAAGGKREGHPN